MCETACHIVGGLLMSADSEPNALGFLGCIDSWYSTWPRRVYGGMVEANMSVLSFIYCTIFPDCKQLWLVHSSSGFSCVLWSIPGFTAYSVFSSLRNWLILLQ